MMLNRAAGVFIIGCLVSVLCWGAYFAAESGIGLGPALLGVWAMFSACYVAMEIAIALLVRK